LKTSKDQKLNDIFVKITAPHQTPQVTRILKGTSAGEWNQTFTFSNIQLQPEEFNNSIITFEVFYLSNFF